MLNCNEAILKSRRNARKWLSVETPERRGITRPTSGKNAAKNQGNKTKLHHSKAAVSGSKSIRSRGRGHLPALTGCGEDYLRVSSGQAEECPSVRGRRRTAAPFRRSKEATANRHAPIGAGGMRHIVTRRKIFKDLNVSTSAARAKLSSRS